MENVNVLEMVKEFLRLEVLENEQAARDLSDEAQATNSRKWKVKRLAEQYGVQQEFIAELRSARSGK